MRPSEERPSQPGCMLSAKGMVAEAAVIVIAGLALGLVANFASPRGLSLTRDYFPASPRSITGKAAQINTAPAAPRSGSVDGTATTTATNASAAAGEGDAGKSDGGVSARLGAHGIGVIALAGVDALYRDPRRVEERIVFVDARKPEKHAEGHIPGAYVFDHYYPQNHLPEVLPVCQLAEVIVVYCTGGTCEDSEFAAILLKEAGVPADRLRVYEGGITDWAAAGLPVENGERGSGQIREGTKGTE